MEQRFGFFVSTQVQRFEFILLFNLWFTNYQFSKTSLVLYLLFSQVLPIPTAINLSHKVTILMCFIDTAPWIYVSQISCSLIYVFNV